MAFGFNYSRAVLSLSVVLITILSLQPKGLRRRFTLTAKDAFAFTSFLYFTAIVLSGLWSTQLNAYFSSVLNAAFFLVMPFSMLILPLYKPLFVKRLVIGICIIMISGILWSLTDYIVDLSYYGLWDRHIPTAPALSKDHIRYSIGIAFAMMTYIFILKRNQEYDLNVLEKIILYCGIGLTALYINLQIGKIGLIAFYSLLLMLLLYIIFTHRNTMVKLLLLVASVTILAIGISTDRFATAWHTFEQELEVFSNNDTDAYENTNSFAPRLISYDVALQLLKDNYLIGVGVGDVKKDMIVGYEHEYGSIKKDNRLVPHNQYLYTFLALGFPLGSLLIGMLIAGFKSRTDPRVKIYVVSISVVTIVICLIEAILVVQMTIYAYLFFLLFFRNIKSLPALEATDEKILS